MLAIWVMLPSTSLRAFLKPLSVLMIFFFVSALRLGSSQISPCRDESLGSDLPNLSLLPTRLIGIRAAVTGKRGPPCAVDPNLQKHYIANSRPIVATLILASLAHATDRRLQSWRSKPQVCIRLAIVTSHAKRLPSYHYFGIKRQEWAHGATEGHGKDLRLPLLLCTSAQHLG